MTQPANEPLYIYDPETAEVLKPVDLLKNVDQLTDEELLDWLTATDTLVRELSPVVSQLTAVMQHRMEADQATLRETTSFTVKLQPQRSYEYDLPKLMTLGDHLTEAQYDKAFKTTVTPNKTELNKLIKLGGPIKQIIETSISEIPKPPKLEITRKAPTVA